MLSAILRGLPIKQARCISLAKRVKNVSVTGKIAQSASMSDQKDKLPHPVRGEPGKVIFGFIPAEWPPHFYNVTGVTGFYTFLFTFGCYIVSKEKLVMEHEYYGGLSMFLLCYLVVSRIGPSFAKDLDKEIDEYEAAWNKGRIDESNMLKENIEAEEKMQWSAEGQVMLVEAKRENVALQLEATFRKRQMDVYKKVKDLLDYQMLVELINRRIAHKQMIIWVTDEVLKSITPEEEAKNIMTCIETLRALSKKHATSV